MKKTVGEAIILSKDEFPKVISLKSRGTGEVSGSIRELTSREVGAKGANIVEVTLWEPEEPHRHPGKEETCICTEGGGEIYFDDGIFPLTPGARVIIPPGVIHAARPKSPLLKFLRISSPPD